MLRNSTAARYEINKSRMVRLAEYSRDCLHALRADTGIQYSELTTGPRLSALVRRRRCGGRISRHFGNRTRHGRTTFEPARRH